MTESLPPVRSRRRLGLLGLGLAAVATAAIIGGWFAVHGTDTLLTSRDDSGGGTRPDVNAIPVTTVQPRRKTLERFFQQPGTVESGAKAEMYAKSAGFLKRIYPTATPELPTTVLAQAGAGQGTGGGPASAFLQLALVAHLASERAPEPWM